MTRLLCALALAANDLFFTGLNAAFWALVFGLYWGTEAAVIGALTGAAFFAAIILIERTRSGRWWWNVGRIDLD